MNPLSVVLVFKISATVLAWCIPLLLMPVKLLEQVGLPPQPSYMFLRLLGWAYVALCVGYWFSLRASLQGKRLMPPIHVGIVSNGGACLFLLYYGLTGAWQEWGLLLQFIGWSSFAATALITAGLIRYGVYGNDPLA